MHVDKKTIDYAAHHFLQREMLSPYFVRFRDWTYVHLNFCIYCAVQARHEDHVPPLTLCQNYPPDTWFTVPACETCNLRLGAKDLPTIEERRFYLGFNPFKWYPDMIARIAEHVSGKLIQTAGSGYAAGINTKALDEAMKKREKKAHGPLAKPVDHYPRGFEIVAAKRQRDLEFEKAVADERALRATRKWSDF